jgi:TetR/AcrR family transcriptional regulator
MPRQSKPGEEPNGRTREFGVAQRKPAEGLAWQKFGTGAARRESAERPAGRNPERGPTRRKSARKPGRPTSTSGLDAREKLLEAATDLFARQGVAATTFAMIAERAGLTPAMLHYYFRDRSQLLDAVVKERLSQLIRSVWGPVDETETPAEVLSGVVDRLLQGIEQMPWVPSTWMREVLNEGGLLRSRVLRHLPFDKIGILSQSVAREQAAGTVNRDVDPGLIVFSLIGLVMMHMATINFWAEIFHRKAPGRDAVGRHITGLLLSGIQPGRLMKRKAGERRK